VLSSLDMTQSLAKKVYETELAAWQGRLSELMRHPEFKKRALILAFEGSDAAGKGGAIRRIMSAMDARQYQIIPDRRADRRGARATLSVAILAAHAAPRRCGHLRPHVVWPRARRAGRGILQQADWLRAYSEINDFEHDLWRAGGIVIKFWLQISDEEQLKRFEERAKVEHKRYKITEEDWRNREKAGCLP
jgi:polyphosphate kinase 2 (PPK2 family)